MAFATVAPSSLNLNSSPAQVKPSRDIFRLIEIMAALPSVVIGFIALGYSYINKANYTPFMPENTTGTFGLFGWTGVMAAAGQIFFTLSIGMGIIQTYASYVKSDDDIAKCRAAYPSR